MNYKVMIEKMEEVFINVGFRPVIINDIKLMKYKECYCKITFFEDWETFIIESAENLQEAENRVFEDSDLYDANIPESELLKQLKSDLINYYLD